MTHVVFVRHGETEWNRARRIQGHSDSALTELGLAQADALAARFARDNIRFDAAYSSDSPRAALTAARLVPNGPAVRTNAALRERGYGVGEGLTHAEIESQFPGAFSRERVLDPDYRIPGGESRRQLRERVIGFFESTLRQHGANEHVLMVTHGGVLAALWRFVHGLGDDAPHAVDIPNVGYNAIEWRAESVRLVQWGDISHLHQATYADAL
jgi:2,3-bisphosphoglycerate-dependent phosphoglycerate mutase